MTQEEKKLLYKDLSARQPYRPFICFAGKFTVPLLDVIASTESNELMSINGLSLEYVKPYLRSMSSMTEEELKDYNKQVDEDTLRIGNEFETPGANMIGLNALDWLLAHHFDYRGLIPMGLALEAPDNMYKQ